MPRSSLARATPCAAIAALACACSAIVGIPDRELAASHDGGAFPEGGAPLDADLPDSALLDGALPEAALPGAGEDATEDAADGGLQLAVSAPTNLAAVETAPGDAALLFVTADGTLTVAFEHANGPWSAHAPISAAGLAPPGAPIAVAWQTPSLLDAFVVASDGAIDVTSVVPGSAWATPSPITASGAAPPGAHLAAAQQGSRLDVFYVDATGTLQELSLAAGGGTTWSGPAALSGTGFAPVGAPIAQGALASTVLDLAIVDVGGTVQTFHRSDEAGAWSGPTAITGSSWTLAGGSLVIEKQSDSQIDLLAVDGKGRAAVFPSSGNGDWAPPNLITPAEGFASPGAPVAASLQGSQLDLFVVDGKGELDVTFVIGNGGWSNPAGLSAASFALPGAPVAVSAQNGTTLDAFVVSDRAAWITWEANDGMWTAPAQIQ